MKNKKWNPWITANEVAEILDTTPDKVNYWGRKQFFGIRILKKARFFYNYKRVLIAKQKWDKLELSKIRSYRKKI